MRADKKSSSKPEKKTVSRGHKRGAVGYSKKTALLEEAITQMNAGKYGRSSSALKDLLALDPHNMEARRLFATLHLRLGSLIPARQAFESLINEAFERQDYWLAESLLREYLAVGPRCVPFLEKLGAVFQEKGNALEAVEEYGKAIDILLDDPDPDNPQHAAQLYAKIRELAPASAVGFRFASSFDAQTGDLIAAPILRTDITLPPESGTESPDAISAMAIADSVAAVMPSEEAEGPPNTFSFATPLPTPSDMPVFPIESGLDAPLSPADEAKEEETISVAQPTTAPAIPEEQIASINFEPEATAGIHDEPLSSLAWTEPAEAIRPECVQEGSEVISAPMPWEDVQEATIRIPDAVSENPVSNLSEAPSPLETGDSPAMASVEAVEAERLEAYSLTDSASATMPAPSSNFSEKSQLNDAQPAGGFSWESVFNTAWKFGETTSPSTISGQETEQTLSIHETQSLEREPESVKTAPVIAAMPWDQIQDTIVTIPPAHTEATAEEVSGGQAASLGEESTQSGISQVTSEQHGSEASFLPTSTAQDIDTFSITQPPPAPPSMEPESPRIGQESAFTAQATESSDLKEDVSPVYRHETGAPAHSNIDVLASVETKEEPDHALTPDNARPSLKLAVSLQEPTQGLDRDQQPSDSTSCVGTAPPTEASATVLPIGLIEDHPIEAITIPELSLINAVPVAEPTALMDSAAELSIADGQAVSSIPALVEQAADPATIAVVEEHSPHVPVTFQESIAPYSASETAQSPSDESSVPSHWTTGEGAVHPQRSRSSHEERPRAEHQQESVPVPPEPIVLEPILPLPEEAAMLSRDVPEEQVVTPQPIPEKEEWIRTGESIRFIDLSSTARAVPAPPRQEEVRVISSAAAAVDVLFESSGRQSRIGTRDPLSPPSMRPRLLVKLARARIGLRMFLRSCFSTTRAIVTSFIALLLLSGGLLALLIGAVGLTWIILEERPSPAFHSLTTIPQRALADSKKNGYLVLLGFDAPDGHDPLQAGSERKPVVRGAHVTAACFGGTPDEINPGRTKASASAANGWFRAPDPVAQFRMHQDTLKGWTSQYEPALGRYKQWLKLSFEDWGYGQSVNPPCASILFTHQLYVAEGFTQGMDAGVDRLELDMEAWRIVLGQARTLPVKMLALQAITDNIEVSSGMLVKPDFDARMLGRLTKILRPLDQVELSTRWPMQSALVAASTTIDAQINAARSDDLPLYAVVASALSLPKQRRLNDYAAYYEASYKAAGEGRYGSLPRWSQYIQFPANSIIDYLTNPMENMIGLEPLPSWERYSGRVVDTDAHLRLASLQAWLRRGPHDGDLLPRIAKAGQSVYDPYTGLPMLVNIRKGVMYSVGHDGKDQDADPQNDVVVTIPVGQPPSLSSTKPSASKSK